MRLAGITGLSEIQQSKVSYSVNGYVNLLHTDDANPDMALMFFRTIAQLSDLDIRVLRLYDYAETTETAYDVMEKAGINYEQYRCMICCFWKNYQKKILKLLTWILGTHDENSLNEIA